MARPSDPSKKKRIIIAAIKLFSQEGFTGTRIAEVAKTAGIGKGTIYEYFRSKKDLFFAAFQHLMSDTGNQMNAVAKSVTGSAALRLSTVAQGVMRLWLANLNLYGLLLEFWSATTVAPDKQRFKSDFQSGYAQWRSALGTLIDEGITAGEFKSNINSEHIASALIGSWDALLLQKWLDPEFDALKASQSHMAVVLAGMQRCRADKE